MLTEARYLDPTNLNSVLMSLGQTVRDPYTGVALTQTDANGLQVTYSYDDLLRPTLQQDTSPNPSVRLGWTRYEYAFSGTGLGSTNLVRTKSSSPSLCSSGPASCFSYHGQSESYLDGFGRSVSQRVERAPGVWSMRYDVYDAFGRLTAASAWGADGTGGGETQYQNFDVYGRPQKVLAPDAGTNPDHVIDIAYTGSRQTVTTTRIGTTFSGPETPFSTTRKFDPFGRLIEIVDPVTTTKYSYSTTGQLLTIVQSAGGASQTRSFQYADDRGFLTQETHPEKGATGNGSIFYKSYDARGHLLAKRDGVDNPSAEVTFVYDSLERLRQVATAGTLARRFTYDELSGGTYRLGRLTTAEAWNTFGAYTGSVTVTERYVYEGRAGAVSQKTTHLNINGADKGTFTQNFTWTDAGQLASETYPSWTLAPSAPARTINYGYNYGQLTSISGFAPSITYHDNFALASIAHSNGVTDWIGKDPDGLGRPSEIHTTGILGGQNWSTGAFAFDGTGNIRSIGGDRFKYDGVSRLVGTQLQLPELTSPTNSFDDGFERGTACNWDYQTPGQDCDGVLRREADQSTTYDSFGNLTSTTTESTTLNIPADPATNRLTSATYDARGNTQGWNANVYDHNLFNEMRRFQSGAQHWLYGFTADGERVVSMAAPAESGGPQRFTIRSLGGAVLREFYAESSTGTPEWKRDWVHGVSGLLAAVDNDAGSPFGESTVHFTLDHLGSPRIVTNDLGAKLAEHIYWPYGVEATTFDQDDLSLKFTGHERDFNDLTSASDDLDYMHARFFNGASGRFLQIDPWPISIGNPGSINRYSYAAGNPIRWSDPSGMNLMSWLKRLFTGRPHLPVIDGGSIDVFAGGGGSSGSIEGEVVARPGEAGENATPYTPGSFTPTTGSNPGVGGSRRTTGSSGGSDSGAGEGADGGTGGEPSTGSKDSDFCRNLPAGPAGYDIQATVNTVRRIHTGVEAIRRFDDGLGSVAAMIEAASYAMMSAVPLPQYGTWNFKKLSNERGAHEALARFGAFHVGVVSGAAGIDPRAMLLIAGVQETIDLDSNRGPVFGETLDDVKVEMQGYVAAHICF